MQGGEKLQVSFKYFSQLLQKPGFTLKQSDATLDGANTNTDMAVCLELSVNTHIDFESSIIFIFIFTFFLTGFHAISLLLGGYTSSAPHFPTVPYPMIFSLESSIPSCLFLSLSFWSLFAFSAVGFSDRFSLKFQLADSFSWPNL